MQDSVGNDLSLIFHPYTLKTALNSPSLQLHTTARLALNKQVPSLFCVFVIHSLFLKRPAIIHHLLESFQSPFKSRFYCEALPIPFHF